MPLIKAALKQSIDIGIETDLEFKAKLYKLTKEAMDDFQSAQRNATLAAGSKAGFLVAQKVASIAFANAMAGLQPIIAETVAEHVSKSVDNYIKLGQVIIPAPLVGAPCVIGAPATIPVVAPGKLI